MTRKGRQNRMKRGRKTTYGDDGDDEEQEEEEEQMETAKVPTKAGPEPATKRGSTEGSRGASVWRRRGRTTPPLQIVAGLPELQARPYGHEVIRQPSNTINRR